MSTTTTNNAHEHMTAEKHAKTSMNYKVKAKQQIGKKRAITKKTSAHFDAEMALILNTSRPDPSLSIWTRLLNVAKGEGSREHRSSEKKTCEKGTLQSKI
jgi:hypothetical protein